MMLHSIAAVLWLLHWLPISAIRGIAAVLGQLLYALAGERRHVGLTNLRLCFPQQDDAWRRRLLRQHFVRMAGVLLEYGYCWFASADRMRALVRIEGQQHLPKDGRPTILFMAHFAGLELAGIRLTLDLPIVTLFSRQKSVTIDAEIERRRTRFATGIAVSRQDGIRPLLRALRQGYLAYYLPDQDFGERDSVFAPFFGVPAATITGLPRLAAAARAKVHPCRLERVPDGYILHIEPAWAEYPSGDSIADAVRMNQHIESWISHEPSGYFWLHKRFKTRPPGEPPVYPKDGPA